MPTSDIKKGPLYVDSTNNRVGVGTSSPATALDVTGAITTDGLTSEAANGTITSKASGASFCSFTANTSAGNNAYVFFQQAGTEMSRITAYNGDVLAFSTGSGAAERMRIDGATGNVGIGGSPSELLHIKNASGDAAVRIQGNTRTFNIQQNNYGLRFVDVDAGSAERMRITAAGDVLIGTQTKETTGTTLYGSTVNGFYIKTTSTCGYLITQAGVGGAGTIVSLYSDNTAVGSITTNGSSASYNTSSDYRLKTAVNYDWDATTRLKQLRPARFEWIADGDDAVPVDGFLAHEVQDVVPEAISGTKDAMRDEEYEVTPAVLDEDGNVVTPAVMGTRSVPDYQGIDQSKLVPLLVKTIQELEARIAALEAS